MLKRKWAVKIGLEIHAQLRVNSKLFSETAINAHALPNSSVSLFDAAYPGTLPVLNRSFVEQALRTSMALNCTVNPISSFERKHYFYLDLPLGYQITQHSKPIAENGILHFRYAEDTESGTELSRPTLLGTLGVERVQIEQDSGKSIHDLHPDYSLVDLNRAGVGLIEIVFKPELTCHEQAAGALRSTQELLRHIGVCDGNLQTGTMRCDVNVSVSDASSSRIPKRVEIKNLNSLQRVRDAAAYEARRQIEVLERGHEVVQETRAFDPVAGTTFAIRTKEVDMDYRYMPEPDLPSISLSAEELQDIRRSLPEIPIETLIRLKSQYGLSDAHADFLINKQGVNYFEECWRIISLNTGLPLHNSTSSSSTSTSTTATTTIPTVDTTATATTTTTTTTSASEEGPKTSPTTTFKWMTGDLLGQLNTLCLSFSASPISPAQFASALTLYHQGVISAPQTKSLINALLTDKYRGADPVQVAQLEGMQRITDYDTILSLVQAAVRDPKHSPQLAKLRGGNPRFEGFFVGSVMKASRGRADPVVVNQALRQVLNELDVAATD